jgi:hypothetical protein
LPQVPYSGVPSVAPSDPPIPRYEANAGPDVFGVNVANAISGLGKAADGAGNEMFTRAIAMQDLYNHSEAQDADARYMQKSGELHAQYSALSGKAAVDAYPDYVKGLQDARSDIRDGLSNGMSQKLFDSQSLSTMGRTIFNGAGHAATQNKEFALNSSKSRVQAIGDTALAQPTDDAGFAAGLAQTKAEVEASMQLNQGAGPDDDLTKEAVVQAQSKLWANRIQGLTKTQPIAAGKMLEQAVKDGQVRGEDIGKLTNLVQGAQNTVGARMVSQQVNSGAGLRWGQGPVDIKQAATAIGQFESGGNYQTIGVQTAHGQALGKYQVMSDNLPEFLTKAGLPSMTADEFLKSPSAQDQVFSAVFGGYMKDKGSFNDAASMWFSGKPMAEAGGRRDALDTSVPAYLTQTNALLAKNAPLSAKVDMGKRIAGEQAPDNPLFPDYVQQRIETDHNQALQIKRDDTWQAQQPIENTLVGAASQNGKLPTTVEELTADPQVAAAWEKLGALNPAKQRYYLNVLARNAKGDHALTPETLKQYTGFTGEAITRPADFVNENILDTDLPITKKAELIKLQQAIQGKTDKGNPAVTQAMGESADMLNAAGIKRTNIDDYDQFTGALADQLRQWSQDNQKPPNYEQRRVIVSRLLQNQSTPGRFWGTNKYPTYQLPVPNDVLEEAKRLNPNLTDVQIQREFTRQKFKELYGGTSKAEKAAMAPSVSQ